MVRHTKLLSSAAVPFYNQINSLSERLLGKCYATKTHANLTSATSIWASGWQLRVLKKWGLKLKGSGRGRQNNGDRHLPGEGLEFQSKRVNVFGKVFFHLHPSPRLWVFVWFYQVEVPTQLEQDVPSITEIEVLKSFPQCLKISSTFHSRLF